MRLVRHLGVLLCGLLFACDAEKPEPPSSTSAKSAKRADAVAQKPSVGAKKPRSKAFEETQAEQLGTLPDGVGIAVGSRVPSLSADDSDGRPFALSDALKKTPVLVMFYRGGWCPFCNFQVRLMTESFPEFKKRGITPVMVSVDRVSAAAKTQSAYDIPFPVLSDSELAWHKAFRVVNEVDAATVERLRSKGMDLEETSGRKHHKVAIPSLFLISKQGEVLFAHAGHDYKVRPGAKALLAALDQVTGL